MSSKAKYCGSYQDGLAFRFKLPKEDLSLKGVQLEENNTPVLLFQVAKKVPTIIEEDVATCIRLSLDNKRPEFFYMRFLSNHPLAGTGRHYKLYSPSYIRRTSIGETLALVDWHMKCLHVGVRGDKDRGIFRSWAETSNLDGLESRENFPINPSKPTNVFMKCKEVCIYNTENQLSFVEEPKMSIEDKCNPGFSNYITNIYDSIAYYDEPIFLKMKEIIKLIVVVEWLRDKDIQFSKTWLQEHASNLQEAPKPLRVELSDEQVDFISNQLQQKAEEAFNNSALKQPSLSVSKYKQYESFTMTKPLEQVKPGCLEVHFKRTFAHPFFLETINLYIPVVQRQVLRATLTDFDFLYEGMDPNKPVTIDPNTWKLNRPEVNSWSELFSETEPFPCKWLQDPDDPNLRTPALTGGVCTSDFPVRSTPTPVSMPTSNTSTIRVEATKECMQQRVRSRDIPPQPVVNAPPSDVRISSHQSQQNAIAKNSTQEMYGHKDLASCFGVSGDGQTIVKQPSLHCRKEIRQMVCDREDLPPLQQSWHLPLPRQKEPGDSGYSSVASSPQSVNSGFQYRDDNSDHTSNTSIQSREIVRSDYDSSTSNTSIQGQESYQKPNNRTSETVTTNTSILRREVPKSSYSDSSNRSVHSREPNSKQKYQDHESQQPNPSSKSASANTSIQGHKVSHTSQMNRSIPARHDQQALPNDNNVSSENRSIPAHQQDSPNDSSICPTNKSVLAHQQGSPNGDEIQSVHQPATPIPAQQSITNDKYSSPIKTSTPVFEYAPVTINGKVQYWVPLKQSLEQFSNC